MTKPDYTPGGFVMASNDLVAALRDAMTKTSLPWVPITDLYHIAEDLLMQGWTKPRAVNTNDGQE